MDMQASGNLKRAVLMSIANQVSIEEMVDTLTEELLNSTKERHSDVNAPGFGLDQDEDFKVEARRFASSLINQACLQLAEDGLIEGVAIGPEGVTKFGDGAENM